MSIRVGRGTLYREIDADDDSRFAGTHAILVCGCQTDLMETYQPRAPARETLTIIHYFSDAFGMNRMRPGNTGPSRFFGTLLLLRHTDCRRPAERIFMLSVISTTVMRINQILMNDYGRLGQWQIVFPHAHLQLLDVFE
jgi:hypothetical protein